jgi:glucose-6-phosphate isomerase
VSVPDKQEIDSLVRGIRGKSIVEVDDAILNGVQSTFRSKKMPFMTLTLPDASSKTIGAYMQLEMMTTMYLSFLLGVNAFDQPAVEEYKSEVRRILGG